MGLKKPSHFEGDFLRVKEPRLSDGQDRFTKFINDFLLPRDVTAVTQLTSY